MCELLGASRVPYIMIFKREGGQIEGFTCPPSKVHLLTDALHEHATQPPGYAEVDPIESELNILEKGSELIQEYNMLAYARHASRR